MNYFQPYLPPLDDAIVAAWDSQVAEAAETPLLAQALAQSAEIFPRFAACYAQLRALPRGARRALQRQLARSSELTAVPPEWRRKLAASLAGAALLLALAQGAQAATITVNIADPAVNTLDTKCSLIEAIINAEHDNQDGSTQCAPGLGADTIVLAKIKKKPLNITLTTYYSDPYYSYAGLPIITGQITIMGNGGKIVRSGAAPQFRIATVSPTGSLTLQNLTLSGGNTYVNGGAINNLGTLRIDKAIISGNTASNGGAVYNSGYSSLTITNGSTISNNRGYTGGGIFNAPESTVTITNSTLSGNSATDGRGGGAYNGPGATLTITNSTLSGNTAGSGGAYYNAGTGGGVYTKSGTLTITNSTISGNTARGAYYGGRGAGVFAAYPNYSAYGGGTVTISNSTITSNTATSGAANPSYASPDSFGGGIFNSNGSSETNNYLTLNRSLISGNSATNGSQIANFQPVSVDVYSPPVYDPYFPYDLISPGTTTTVNIVTANNFNLFGSNNDAGIYDPNGVTGLAPGTTDVVPSVTFSAILGPLKANGGLTKTHALVAKTSPALKKVTSGCPATDQRGTKRPQPKNTPCDIGSFEQK